MTNRNNWKTGLSAGLASPENLARAAEGGIQTLEVTGIKQGLDWSDLPKWVADSGVTVQSYHLPFIWPKQGTCSNPATLDPVEWEQTKQNCVPAIENASQGGVGIFVIHPSLEPNPEEGPEREALIESSIEHLSYLSDICRKNGSILAVEDLPRTCLGNTDAELLRIMKANSDLRVCFDVNHLLKGTHADFIKTLAPYIVTTHISDYDFVDERHIFPTESRNGYEGKINWGELQRLLEEADYDGAWLYEVYMDERPYSDVAKNRKMLLGL